MARESQVALVARTAEIIRGLAAAYPGAHCELNFSNPLELLVATILSAQCTDKQVNLVTKGLFEKYRAAADFANAEVKDLEQDIRRIGLFRNKAKNIKACCQTLVERHGGVVPRTMFELVNLAGVGRKTANVVLGNAYHTNAGVVVDTHVARLSARLGLSRAKGAEKIEEALMKLVPVEDWANFSHWLIWHGRRRCGARKPDCTNCEINSLCPSAGKV